MKNITDLSQEELKALFKANKHLQEEVQERLLDSANYWIDEILTPFTKIQGAEYSISCYNDYFYFKYPDSFPEVLEAAEKMQRDFEILTPETMELVKRAGEKSSFSEIAIITMRIYP